MPRLLHLLALGLLSALSACGQSSKNSAPVTLLPAAPAQAGNETLILASGCFWGTEYFLKRIDGVLSTTVGYTGGHVENPSYEQVCGKRTGHYEACLVEFDPKRTTAEEVLRTFFETHDPTQANGQGPDIGPQYLSAVFYQNEAQRDLTQSLIGLLTAKGLKVATEVLPAQAFYSAEGYHQDYYDIKGGTPYCHGYRKLF
ncbi:MAG: peptide-methionine (S)-S-oxide reductase [Flavobacteriales bacterium]|nr:MAG: peptide-methionine (S)-S-oxide reductase [Flavobacteriales bacterium]